MLVIHNHYALHNSHKFNFLHVIKHAMLQEYMYEYVYELCW